MRGLRRRQHSGWEQARLIAFYCLRPWVKDLQMEMLPQFPWEKMTQTVDADDEAARIAYMREHADDYKKVLEDIYGKHNQ